MGSKETNRSRRVDDGQKQEGTHPSFRKRILSNLGQEHKRILLKTRDLGHFWAFPGLGEMGSQYPSPARMTTTACREVSDWNTLSRTPTPLDRKSLERRTT